VLPRGTAFVFRTVQVRRRTASMTTIKKSCFAAFVVLLWRSPAAAPAGRSVCMMCI
jgi:hypothetical protein